MRCRVFPLVLVLGVAMPLSAAPIVLDFESLSDSELVSNQFAGLLFQNTIALTAGIGLNEFEFPPVSGLNVVSDIGGAISVTFASPVQSFGGYFTYLTRLTITAFEAGGAQVGQTFSLFNNNLALSGDLGSNPNEFLQVAFLGGITTIVVAGDPAGGSFALDNLTYEGPASAVPEPSSLTLGLMASLFFVVFRHRAGRNLLLVGVCLAGSRLWGAPNIGTPSAIPSAIVVNTPQSVSVTIPIPDQTVIPTGVNLLRVNPSGGPSMVIGQLHDDGVNGDAVGGDHLFSIRLQLNEPAVTTIQFQVSAAFRGTLLRALSPVFNVSVTTTGTLPLPPDPGTAGLVTLSGIDTDRDGVPSGVT